MSLTDDQLVGIEQRVDRDHKVSMVGLDEMYPECACGSNPMCPDRDDLTLLLAEVRAQAQRIKDLKGLLRAQTTLSIELEGERDQSQRGGKELGKVIDHLGDLIKAAFLHGADDPIGAVRMLGEFLVGMSEEECGLSAEEHDRVFQALDARRAEVVHGKLDRVGDWAEAGEYLAKVEAERAQLAGQVERVREEISATRSHATEHEDIATNAGRGSPVRARREQAIAEELADRADRFERALNGGDGS